MNLIPRPYFILNIIIIFIGLTVNAQCPQFTNSTFTANCGSPCVLCINQDISLGVSGINIPSGTCVKWYYSNTLGFNPYNGEGTYIGCSTINGPGMFYTNLQTTSAMCELGDIYVVGIIDPAVLGNCPQIFTNQFSFSVECINATIGDGGNFCYGASFGLFADGGVQYQWSGPNGFSSNLQTPIVDNTTSANQGTYYVTVTGAAGCTEVKSIYVSLYSAIILDFIYPSEPWYVCEGSNDSLFATIINPGSGSIKIIGWSHNLFGGDEFSTNWAIIPSEDGFYYFGVQDKITGCKTGIDYVVEHIPAPKVNISPNPASICPGGNLVLTANVTGGIEPYEYLWSTGETSENITISNPGIYQVTVTGANGCTDSAKVDIKIGNPVNVLIFPYSTIVCSGEDNFISASASGGISPYNYQWSTPFGNYNVSDINAIIPGNYKVTVTDLIGCMGNANITIKLNPNISLSVTPDSAFICNNNLVTLTANATGGSGANYQFKWTTPSGQLYTGAVLNTTEKGYFTVTVTDGVGCTKEEHAVVIELSSLNIYINPNPASFCTGDSIILNASVQGGVGTYSYAWSSLNGISNNKNIIAKSYGYYYVTITDVNGCSGIKSINVTNKDSLKVVILPSSPNFCMGDSLILIAITADTGVLTYTWSNGIISYTGDTIVVNKGGKYIVNVSSNTGCPAKDSVSIQEIINPEISLSPDPASFCAGSSVSLTATTNDTSIVSYNWNTPSGSYSSQSITANIAGQYVVNLTNSFGCVGFDTINVVQIDKLPVVISPDPASFCPGYNIKLTAISTEPGLINYIWSTPIGAQTANEITADLAGNYIVTITNSTGCSGTASVNVTESPGLIVTIDPDNAGFCTGNSVNLTAKTTGAKLSYLWAFPGGASSTNQIINTNKSGSYSVTVTDEGGCTGTASIEVKEYAGLDIKIDPDPASFCNNGSVVLTAINNNGVGPFTYEWNTPIGSASTNTFDANTIGTYSVTVTDANACSGTATTQVSQSNSLSLSFNPFNLGFCPGKSIDLTVKANGGQQPYTYSWNTPLGNYNSNSINTNTAGSYLVTVTDKNGCSGISDAEIKAFSIPIIDLASTLGFCPGNVANIKANVSDVQTPLLYSWNTPSGGSKLDSFLVNTPGNYYVTVTNAVGCTAIDSTTLVKWDIPYIKYSPFPVEFCKGKSVTVIAGATIGFAPFSYFWQGPSATYNDSTLIIYEAGKYYLTVSDAHGCTSNINLSANELPGLAVSVITDPDVLCGAMSFNVIPQVQGGKPPYTYEWHTPTGTEATATLHSNEFGNYAVTVSDAKGCNGIDSLLVKADSLSVVLDKTDPGCISIKAGSISLLSATNPSFPMQLVLNNKPPVIINSLPYLLNTLSAGTYNINITGDNGCKQSLNLELIEPSTPSLKLGEDVTIFLGETYTIKPIASFIIDSIKWTNKSSLECTPGCVEPIASPQFSTTYKATAYSKDGCKATDDINIYVVEKESVYIPNSFSPNGDGINDQWLVFTDQTVKQIKKMYIYDRWGEAILIQENFPPNDPAYGWNGKFRNQLMNDAVFVFYVQVEFNDGRVKEYKGDINLLR